MAPSSRDFVKEKENMLPENVQYAVKYSCGGLVLKLLLKTISPHTFMYTRFLCYNLPVECNLLLLSHIGSISYSKIIYYIISQCVAMRKVWALV